MFDNNSGGSPAATTVITDAPINTATPPAHIPSSRSEVNTYNHHFRSIAQPKPQSQQQSHPSFLKTCPQPSAPAPTPAQPPYRPLSSFSRLSQQKQQPLPIISKPVNVNQYNQYQYMQNSNNKNNKPMNGK